MKHLLTVLAAVLIASSTQAANYYISASGPQGSGDGSSAANAADASSASKYRAINQSHNAPGTVIQYSPGYYQMPAGLTMFNGVTHQGAGIDKTVIQLANGSVSSSSERMWTPGRGSISNWKFSDATIDLNSVNQPAWSNNSFRSLCFQFTLADHCTIQRIKFINIGSRGGESFPIYFGLGQSSGGTMNNNLVDSCIFSNPVRSGNTDGVTLIYMAELPGLFTVDNTNVVSNCQFTGFATGSADFKYTQCITAPVAINNTATNVDALWFVEPGARGNTYFSSGRTLQVTGNTVNGGYVARVLMHSNGHLDADLNIQNNQVNMGQSEYSYYSARAPGGVSFEDYAGSGNGLIGNVTIQGNTFVAPSPLIRSPVAVSINPKSPSLYHLASLSIVNNHLVKFPETGDANVGAQWRVNPGQTGSYTNSGNVFGSSSPTPTPTPGP